MMEKYDTIYSISGKLSTWKCLSKKQKKKNHW
jgi:hypothetical protein